MTTRSCSSRRSGLRRVTALGILLFLAGICPASLPAAPPSPQLHGVQVLRVSIENKSQLATLIALDAASRDLEIWSDGVVLGEVDVRVSLDQKRAIEASGLGYRIEIDDLQAHLDKLYGGARGGGFFEVYRTYDEHVGFLADLAAAYPDLAEIVQVGLSVLGRPMTAIRITGPGSDKPGVFYNGGQHGNEIMGPCVVAYMADYLLTNYETDSEVQTLVDRVEWFLLPIMNPDGYVAHTRQNANRYDLNRNWGGPGSGYAPFSQPETAAMRDLFAAHPNIRAHIDFHTYGRMILWPWGQTEDLCDDELTYQGVGDEMAELIYQHRGSLYYRRGPIYTTIYPVSGGSTDYVYGELGVWSLGFELGYSHSMPTSEIIPTGIEIASAMLMFSDWISDCNDNDVLDGQEIAAGLSLDCNENRMPDECESTDFDGDGMLNVCDPDIDNDGVLNDWDVCDFTEPGALVDVDGRPIGDTDEDCDVSLADYFRLPISCLPGSGPGVPAPISICTTWYGFDNDTDIDLVDVAGFMNAFTGDQ